jgi:hypothetical protein
MSGIEDLMAGVREGLQLGQKAFASGGQVKGYALGGEIDSDYGGYAAPTGSATTQPVASTAPVASAPWAPTWIDVGGVLMPTIRKDDLGYYEQTYNDPASQEPWYGPEEARPVAPDPYTVRNYQLNGDAYGALAGDSRNAFNSWSNNYMVEGIDDNNLNVRVKTDDKEGTNIRYELRDGIWTPVANAGTQDWNTNRMEPMDWVRAIGGAIGAPALGYLLTTGVGGALADLGLEAGMETGLEGFAGSGLEGGVGAIEGAANPYALTAAELGAPVETYLGTGVVAGEGGAATLGSTAASLAGQYPSYIVDAVNTAVNTGQSLESVLLANGISLDPAQWTLPSSQYVPETEPYAPGENPTPLNNPNGALPTNPVPSLLERAGQWVLNNPGAALTTAGIVGSALENPDDPTGGGGGASGGFNQPITAQSLTRSYTPAPAGYRPGFSPEHQYVNYQIGSAPGSTPVAPNPTAPPLPPYTGPAMIDPETAFAPPGFAAGGIAALRTGGGGHVKGPGDGMSDSIPATIEGQQPAALGNDEFVVPADVVSDLGNGSSEAGAQVLYAMMDRIRQARHGTTEQPPEIDPGKFLPA